MLTNAQMLRHLRRHPYRRWAASVLLEVAAQHRGKGLAPRAWSRTLNEIFWEIVR